MPRRVVLKFGSGTLTNMDRAELDDAQLEALVAAVAAQRKAGNEMIVVSSGAVAAGLPSLGLDSRPLDLATLQACAAVGQTRLMHHYDRLFSNFGLSVGQLLLTHDDLRTPERRTTIGNTFSRLLAFEHTVPVINENDSVAVEELSYGDNDLLSADVACLLEADALVLLTTVDGLYPPDSDEILTKVLPEEMESALGFATAEKGTLSVGGMTSKLRAVQRATDAGIDTYIANGRRADQLGELLSGKGRGTFFPGRASA